MRFPSDNQGKFNSDNRERTKKSKTHKKNNHHAITETDILHFEQVKDDLFFQKIQYLWFEYRKQLEIDHALDTKDEVLFRQLLSPNWKNVVTKRFQEELKR